MALSRGVREACAETATQSAGATQEELLAQSARHEEELGRMRCHAMDAQQQYEAELAAALEAEKRRVSQGIALSVAPPPPPPPPPAVLCVAYPTLHPTTRAAHAACMRTLCVILVQLGTHTRPHAPTRSLARTSFQHRSLTLLCCRVRTGVTHSECRCSVSYLQCSYRERGSSALPVSETETTTWWQWPPPWIRRVCRLSW